MVVVNGRYIVFEGIDGCGKTTQSLRLAEQLSKAGHRVLLTREPGGVGSHSMRDAGVDVRKYVMDAGNTCAPATLELLLQADRAEHTANIKKYLDDGHTVISDRSFISGLAYGRANGHNYESIIPVVDFAVSVLPDHVIFLDCPVQTAFGRMNNGRGALSREEQRGKSFMSSVRQNFLDIIFGSVGREHDLLRRFDKSCRAARICIEDSSADQVAVCVDVFLG